MARKTVASYPALARQWHPKRNGALQPHDVPHMSMFRAWWKCPKGADHVWQAPVKSRQRANKNPCPFCANRRANASNCLARKFPKIARQWHPTKNGRLGPNEVVASSARKVWWKCPKGRDHQWEHTVYERTKLGRGCPFCRGRRASETNSLAARAPAVARQWHPTRNGKLRPKDVPQGTKKKVWWKCNQGPNHEWEATVASRTRKLPAACPFCAGQRVCASNSLARGLPALAKQWHPTKNGELSPRHVTVRSGKRVWWKCRHGTDHEWQTAVAARTANDGHGTGCPFCSNRRASVTNSLPTQAKRLAAQWHPTKNRGLNPEGVTARSGKVVWWQCSKGHSWKCSVGDRVAHGRECPQCRRL